MLMKNYILDQKKSISNIEIFLSEIEGEKNFFKDGKYN